MNIIALALILFTVTLSAFGQLILKIGVSRPRMETALRTGIVESVMAALATPLIWFGLALYVVAAATWIWVLSRVDLSVAYPFIGVSFVLTMAFGALLLNEPVDSIRISGGILVAIGCAMIARSA